MEDHVSECIGSGTREKQKMMAIDITQNNTPIAPGERAGDAPKTCGCGGTRCGSKVQAGETNGKLAQLILLAVIVIGSAICFFLFS